MMRFMAFAEYYSKDYEAALAFNRDIIQAERSKYPSKYPKKFLPDHFLRGPLPKLGTDSCTLSFYEPTDPKQLSNIATRWVTLNKYTFVPVETEGAGWRFIAFVEGYVKDLEARIKRNLEIQGEREKYPDRYPKKFLEDHWLMSPLPKLSRDGCALAFYETSDQKQLVNIAMKWMPMMKFSFTHIAESTAAIEILREVTKMTI